MDFSWISAYWPLIVAGAVQTVLLLVISVGFGFLLAIGLALAQVIGPRWLRWLAKGYCTAFRGTPLLIQLWLFYYGVGSFLPMIPGLRESMLWPIVREGFFFAAVSFTLNYAAYEAEVLRGALLAVPKGSSKPGAPSACVPSRCFVVSGCRGRSVSPCPRSAARSFSS